MLSNDYLPWALNESCLREAKKLEQIRYRKLEFSAGVNVQDCMSVGACGVASSDKTAMSFSDGVNSCAEANLPEPLGTTRADCMMTKVRRCYQLLIR